MKIKTKTALSLMLVAGGSIALADSPDLSKLPPPSEKQNLTYQKDVRPLFEASCFRCHTGDRAKAGLHLDTLEGVLKGTKHGAVVKPGDSKGSQLVVAVAQLDPKTAMPPKHRPGGRGRGPRGPGGPDGGAGGPPPGAGAPPPEGAGRPRGGFGPPPKPLTSEQVGVIRAWIDQGAK